MNLIFDMDYHFYRSLYVLKNFSESKIFLDEQEDQISLIKKIKMDIFYTIKKFRPLGIQNIILCSDSYSWRKKILSTYKEHRKTKKPDINWNEFYRMINSFLGVMEKIPGFIISKIESAEADDLAFLWKDYFFNKQSENVILVTSDKDWSQLTDFNENKKNFVIFYSNLIKSKFIIPSQLMDSIYDIKETKKRSSLSKENYKKDLASTDVTTNLFLQELMKNNEYEDFNDLHFNLEKLFLGDASDDVPNSYLWIEKDTPKKITRTHIKYVYNNLIVKYPDVTIHDIIKNREILDYICLRLSEKIKNFEPEVFIENFIRNYKLTVLNYENIPDEIQEQFELNIKNYEFDKMNASTINDITIENIIKDIFNIDTFEPEERKIKIYSSIF